MNSPNGREKRIHGAMHCDGKATRRTTYHDGTCGHPCQTVAMRTQETKPYCDTHRDTVGTCFPSDRCGGSDGWRGVYMGAVNDEGGRAQTVTGGGALGDGEEGTRRRRRGGGGQRRWVGPEAVGALDRRSLPRRATGGPTPTRSYRHHRRGRPFRHPAAG